MGFCTRAVLLIFCTFIGAHGQSLTESIAQHQEYLQSLYKKASALQPKPSGLQRAEQLTNPLIVGIDQEYLEALADLDKILSESFFIQDSIINEIILQSVSDTAVNLFLFIDEKINPSLLKSKKQFLYPPLKRCIEKRKKTDLYPLLLTLSDDPKADFTACSENSLELRALAGDTPMIDSLIMRFENEQDYNEAVKLVNSLGRIGTPRIDSVLLKNISKRCPEHSESAIKTRVLRALAYTNPAVPCLNTIATVIEYGDEDYAYSHALSLLYIQAAENGWSEVDCVNKRRTLMLNFIGGMYDLSIVRAKYETIRKWALDTYGLTISDDRPFFRQSYSQRNYSPSGMTPLRILTPQPSSK